MRGVRPLRPGGRVELVNDPPFSGDELVVQGGNWAGLLFENPRPAHPLSLSWAFHFDFGSLQMDGELITPSLDIEWVSVDTPGWMAMTGVHVACSKFADPAEASVYTFMHHRFDVVNLTIAEQEGPRVSVQATVSGDIDGLGVPSITVEAWLEFAGIYVQPHERPSTCGAAVDLLRCHTDVVGLTAYDLGHNYVLKPGGCVPRVAAQPERRKPLVEFDPEPLGSVDGAQSLRSIKASMDSAEQRGQIELTTPPKGTQYPQNVFFDLWVVSLGQTSTEQCQ